jgi:hypothetical protein
VASLWASDLPNATSPQALPPFPTEVAAVRPSCSLRGLQPPYLSSCLRVYTDIIPHVLMPAAGPCRWMSGSSASHLVHLSPLVPPPHHYHHHHHDTWLVLHLSFRSCECEREDAQGKNQGAKEARGPYGACVKYHQSFTDPRVH